jgi:hypothetical protein
MTMGRTHKQQQVQSLDTVSEYQRRLRLATKWGTPFLISTASCVVGIIVLFNVDIFTPTVSATLFLILLLGAFASWGLHLYFETRYNRCPNCEHVPRDSRGAVDFNPAACPVCGARLRDYDSLF